MRTKYPAKVLIAWSEAIDENKRIREWLMQNGYEELGVFCFALRNKEDARKWLLDNGFPHLMATIRASEGDKKAVEWLINYGFDILAHVGAAADGEEKAFQWLLNNNQREFALIAKKMEMVKDQIERDNNDVHKISKE